MKAIIIHDLYSLKSAGEAFCQQLDDCTIHVGYNLFPDEPDMWIKPKVEIDGDSYYSYILCYVYDILFVHQNYMTMISNTNNYFKMKPDSIGDPGMYLEDSVGTSDTAYSSHE